MTSLTTLSVSRIVLAILILAFLLLSFISCQDNQTGPADEYSEEDSNDTYSLSFNVVVPTETPETDIIFVELNGNIPEAINIQLINEEAAPQIWTAQIKIPAREDFEYQIEYRYTRNNLGYVASELFTPDSKTLQRKKTLDSYEMTLEDTVSAWRWIPKSPPTANTELPADVISIKSTSFQKGIAVFDVSDPTYIPLIANTLRHIQSLEAGWVQLPVVYDAPTGDRTQPYTMPDPVIKSFIEQAHQLGLKVILSAGPFGGEFLGHEDAIEAYSRLAEEAGAEVFMIGTGLLQNGNDFQMFDTGMKDLIATARSNYNGALTIDFLPGIPETVNEKYTFVNQLDYLGDKWWPRLADHKDASFEEMLAKARQYMTDHFEQLYEDYGLPILITQIGYGSFDGAAMQEISTEDPRVAEWEPIDPTFPFDFQEQVDAYNASLQAIAEQDWIIGAYSFGYAYWDTVDKSPSIRAKPAAELIREWYRKLPS